MDAALEPAEQCGVTILCTQEHKQAKNTPSKCSMLILIVSESCRYKIRTLSDVRAKVGYKICKMSVPCHMPAGTGSQGLV
jgi:hypothetical protein